MLDNSIRDRALGAIVGAAVGDALGASYEFLTASEIASQGDITMRQVGARQKNPPRTPALQVSGQTIPP